MTAIITHLFPAIVCARYCSKHRHTLTDPSVLSDPKVSLLWSKLFHISSLLLLLDWISKLDVSQASRKNLPCLLSSGRASYAETETGRYFLSVPSLWLYIFFFVFIIDKVPCLIYFSLAILFPYKNDVFLK